MELRRLLPYGITQCYLPHDTSEHTPPYSTRQASTRFTYPQRMEGWVDHCFSWMSWQYTNSWLEWQM